MPKRTAPNVAVPDARGYLHLKQLIDDVSDIYIIDVDDNGVITLTPAVVTAAIED